jgi:hypothetical protein
MRYVANFFVPFTVFFFAAKTQLGFLSALILGIATSFLMYVLQIQLGYRQWAKSQREEADRWAEAIRRMDADARRSFELLLKSQLPADQYFALDDADRYACGQLLFDWRGRFIRLVGSPNHPPSQPNEKEDPAYLTMADLAAR